MSNVARDFKSRLSSGETLFGTMLTLPTPATAEILASAGFDWFFIDGEHGPLGTAEILNILQAVSHRIACIVRVPEAAEVPIKKVLDIGAHGIIVPQVNSLEQAEAVVRWARYSPEGTRGVGLARAHGYGSTFAEYLENANADLTVMVQAEHAQAVENIDAMVRIPGIDAIQLGPYDLSASMGKMGQIDDPEVVAAIERVYSACREVNMPVGCFGVSATNVRKDMERGSRLVCAGVDTLLLARSGAKMLENLRG